jgi:hypothetical protein
MLSCTGYPPKQLTYQLTTNSLTNQLSFSFVWVVCVTLILSTAPTVLKWAQRTVR